MRFVNLWSALVARARRLGQDARGSVLVELALAVPVVTGLIIGGVELSRYAQIHQKMNRLALQMSDLVTQSDSLRESDFTNIFGAVVHIVDPYNMATDGRVIISSVSFAAGGTVINWQRNNGGALSVTSQIGNEGGAATLPAGLTLQDGDELIISEVFFSFTPILFNQVIPPRQIQHISYMRPRFGTLDHVDP
ncbi:MAG: pilus assembly protein [Sphingomonadales bacterium]|nr:pilus assembly protein [Sphingomonadales bacterium]